jgi:flagellin
MLTINTNALSLQAQAAMTSSSNALATSMQRLSSGLRINSAKDDAAGLAVAEKMTSQINGMNAAVQNTNNGISLVQTADSALASVGDDLQRMRELAVEARNSTNSSSDQDSLNLEFRQLGAQVQSVLGGTTFNGKTILGANAGTLDFQVGANLTANDSISVATSNLTADTTISAVSAPGGSLASIDSTMSFASLGAVINGLDAAIDDINNQRTGLGASQNRFTATVANLQSGVVNQSAAHSHIMDADFASETANLSRAQILQQVGTAMIAQANQSPQQVLKLLQG